MSDIITRVAPDGRTTRQWKCDRCGATVIGGAVFTVECSCGAQYNGYGQRLRDDWAGNPSNWDDEIGDMEGFEIQHAGDDQ